MKTIISIIFLALTTAKALADTAVIAQLGAPVNDNERYALIMLRELGEEPPSSAYTVSMKSGNASSANPYSRLAVIQPSTNLAVIQSILNRSHDAGLDNTQLETALDAIAAGAFPEEATLAEKLSLVLRGEFSQNGRESQKEVLIRVFPQVAMACGSAYLARITENAEATFELRTFDPTAQTEGAVIGRVTTPASAPSLPAPAGMLEDAEQSPAGHLRVRLLWWISEALRERTLHACGYHVYRIDHEQWLASEGSDPPANLTRTALLSGLQNGLITQVNACPILPDQVYESEPAPEDAAFFFTDDNDSRTQSRFDEGGEPFTNGQRLVYYTAATDYFGNPGIPSPGLPITVCDRLPPNPPRGLRIDNQYRYDTNTDQGTPYFRLSWKPDPTGEVTRYHIYQYDEPGEALADVNTAGAPATLNRIGTIENDPTATRLVYNHLGPGAPSLPADEAKTFWFCIRAEDNSACQDITGFGNIGLPCGTVPGTLYNFEGPESPGGRIIIPCCRFDINGLPGSNNSPNGIETTLRAIRPHASVLWVEFRKFPSLEMIGHFEFPPGVDEIETTVTNTPGTVFYEARFGLRSGRISQWISGPSITSSGLHIWRGELLCEPDNLVNCSGGIYDPDPTGSGDVHLPCFVLGRPSESHSWRLYRRVGNGGALTLVDSGKYDDTDTACEIGVPGFNSTVCYFAQVYDIDGNPSSFAKIGSITYSRPDNLPQPMIREAQPFPLPAFDESEALMSLTWVSSDVGVERFELEFFPPLPGITDTFFEGSVEKGRVLSPRLPTGFGNGEGSYSQVVRVELGRTYHVRVRALGVAAPSNPQAHAHGEWSEPLSMRWSFSQEMTDDVPWPARPVPGVKISKPAFTEMWTLQGYPQPLVEIGQLDPRFVTKSDFNSLGVQTFVTLKSLDRFVDPDLPLVLYRADISPGNRHQMIQVSPLLRRILLTQQGDEWQVTDPFIIVKRRNAQMSNPNAPYSIWIKDTQPMIQGRTYLYRLVQLAGNGEIKQVISSTTLTAN